MLILLAFSFKLSIKYSGNLILIGLEVGFKLGNLAFAKSLGSR